VVLRMAAVAVMAIGCAALAAPTPAQTTAAAARDAAPSGDAQRGQAIVLDRTVGLCLLCHSGPFPSERFQGNLAPSLSGIGARLNRAQLRDRVEDSRRLNPASIMPTYGPQPASTADQRVGQAFDGKPILSAQQIDDVVAFLATLTAP
jgi:L-cysteine S-thiosulfotransferase